MEIHRISALGVLLWWTAFSIAEERTFQVTVDGKPAGVAHMKSVVNGDLETVDMSVDVRFRTFGIKYEYNSKSSEIWKGSELQKLDSTVNDDGKKSHVKAELGAQELTTMINGHTGTCAKNALPATGWRIPRLDKQLQEVTILDGDDGSVVNARIEYVGRVSLKLGNQAIEGYRYKVSGKGIDAEWVYDAAGKPVRQLMKWDGYAVLLELSGIEK